MKLEGEFPFFHSKVGREPDSQSFEFNDSDQNTAGYKLQNHKGKENENGVSVNLKKKERGLDLSPYDMEPKLEFYNSVIDLNDDYEAQVIGSVKDKRGLDPSPYNMESAAAGITPPKLAFYDSVIDSNNEFEAQVIGLVEPVSHSSKDIESLLYLTSNNQETLNKGSVKKSPTSPISNPLKGIDKFGNSVDVYTDKTVRECEPELVVCCNENNYHVVKDICVDEGVVTKHKIMFEVSEDEKDYNFVPMESFQYKEKLKDNADVKVLNLPATVESDQVSANPDRPKDLMCRDEDMTENLVHNVNKGRVLPEDKVFLHELDSEDATPSVDKGKQVCSEPALHSQCKKSKNIVEGAVLASPPFTLAVDESNSDGTSLAYSPEPSSPAGCGKMECHQLGACNCDEIQLASKPVEGQSDYHAETSQIRHSLGESSFSAVGAVSSRISYSGSIPYSGSISIRSDSSTTSTRSFAFPVLQSEWNSSPVRMAKPDRSHYRKHRSWRQGLLCCKF